MHSYGNPWATSGTWTGWERRAVRGRVIVDASGTFRVMYVTKFEEAIYVLHCFQKKTQETSKQARAIAAARYRAVPSARKEEK